MIGYDLDIVLDGIRIIIDHCGSSKVNIIDEKGHYIGHYHHKGIYLELDPNIKIFSDVVGNNIIERINYLIKRERWMVRASDPTLREVVYHII